MCSYIVEKASLVGSAKGRTNDNTQGEERELDKSPFPG